MEMVLKNFIWSYTFLGKAIMFLCFIQLLIVITGCTNKKDAPCFPLPTPEYDGNLVSILDERTQKPVKDTLVDLIEKKRDIYRPCTTYLYDGNISIKNKKIFHTKIDLYVLGKRFAPDSFKQDEIVYRFYDYGFDESYHSYISEEQIDQLKYSSTTGIIENVESVWTHPFRSGPFYKLEACPFPEVRLPIEKNKTWTGTLSIGQGWNELSNTYNNMYYKAIDTCSIKVPFDPKLKTWKIYAESENSNMNKCIHTFYFNEKYGFVKQEYIINDSIEIRFDLSKF
jgi:hypothetical protein